MLQFQRINRYVRENLVLYEFRCNGYIDVTCRLFLNNDAFYLVVVSKSPLSDITHRYKILSLLHRELLKKSKQYQRRIVFYLLKYENFLP